jgi:ribose/xylose/arabinose/galactoside ABC-type transport system permease subunit
MIKAKEFVKHIDLNELYILFGLFGLCVILSFLSPVFLTVANISNVILQASINATLACGMTFVIISGGIDLSVGSVLALSGVVMGSILKADVPLLLALSSSLIAGALCGLVNGLFITLGNLPPFISTLGMMSVARGAALFYTGGRSISGFKLNFMLLGSGTILGIPILIVIMAVTYIIAFFILKYIQLGRYTYAIGGNEEATRLSGISVRWYKTIVYVISGLTSGIAAIMLTARLNSAQPIAGITYELDAIAATVIGGTSLSGGEGKISGTIIGALIISVLRNGLNLLNVSSYIQQIVIGAVIIAAVLVDKAKKR